jgi:pimeloyl-ACP methyl ester carboxylesterase
LSDKFILLAAHSQDPAGKMMPEDQVAFLKLLKWAEKNYPVNPRRVYMYGKGEGGKISGEFAVMHPDVVTAAISYSWGWWSMPSELEKPIEMQNSAAEFYLVLGLRDLSHHVTTVRDTYERLRAKGYHTIYREFDELGDRSYHPVSNDDALSWATRLRNKNIPPSAEEMNLLKAFSASKPPAPVSGYYPTWPWRVEVPPVKCCKGFSSQVTPMSAPPRPKPAATAFLVRLPPQPSENCLLTPHLKFATRRSVRSHHMPTGVPQRLSRS